MGQAALAMPGIFYRAFIYIVVVATTRRLPQIRILLLEMPPLAKLHSSTTSDHLWKKTACNTVVPELICDSVVNTFGL